MNVRFFKYAPLALVPLLCIYVWTNYRNWRALKTTSPVGYTVLEDGLGTTMTIGIDSSVTEQQLIATLARAADDHQNDAARDLLFSSYFSVEAYLLERGERSSELAGRIKRYVPLKATTDHNDWMDFLPELYGKGDMFWITLSKARKGLNR